MKIVFDDKEVFPTQVTGDPRNWKEGLYVPVKGRYNDQIILVYRGTALHASADSGLQIVVDNDSFWRRVPGYTGKIASITPEWAGA